MKPYVREPKQKGTRGQTAKARATCGAKKKSGGKCTLAPGWGTVHPGVGRCKLHGGSVPNHVKAAAGQELRKLLGSEKEMNPFEAIMWCIRIRAGEVEWLSTEMSRLQEASWVEDTLIGKQFHLYARERQAAMSDLVRYSQIAISLGIAERYVRLAEVYGETIAQLIKNILSDPDLALTEAQQANIPMVVRRHLIAIQGATSEPDIIEGSAKELPAAKEAA